MRMLILGPPGAGKGTQASRLAAHYAIPAISTGDIFRANIADGTPLGVRVQDIVNSGGYVPDELTNELVKSRLSEPDAAEGFLLDGYPRTGAQVDELDAMLAAEGRSLDAVAELTVPGEELIERLVLRAQTDGRVDDTAEVIRSRQELYTEQTAPLLAVYRDRGLLVQVDGLGEVYEVSERLFAALDSHLARTAS